MKYPNVTGDFIYEFLQSKYNRATFDVLTYA